MTAVIDQIRTALSRAERDAQGEFTALARKVASGVEVDPDEAADVLFAAEKSADDLVREADRIGRRVADQGEAGQLPRIEAELARVEKQIVAKDAEIASILEGHRAAMADLLSRRTELTNQRMAAHRAWSRTLSQGIPADVAAEAHAAGRRVVQAQNRLAYLRDSAGACQNFVAEAERRKQRAGTTESKQAAQADLDKHARRLAERQAEVDQAERELAEARAEQSRIEALTAKA